MLKIFRMFMATMIIVGLIISAIPGYAQDIKNETIEWSGQGPADPGCQVGQTAKWHFILTAGGNNTLVSGNMTATFSNGNSDSDEGEHKGGNRGAMHFYVSTAAPAHVTSASVTFSYEGDGGNFQFVISDASCEGDFATPTPTLTPEGETETPTPTPTSTATATATQTATQVPLYWADAGADCFNRSADVRNGELTVVFSVQAENGNFTEKVEVKAGDNPISTISMWQNGTPWGKTEITWTGIYTHGEQTLNISGSFSDVCGLPAPTNTPTVTPTVTSTARRVPTGTTMPTAGAGVYPISNGNPMPPLQAIGLTLVLFGAVGLSGSFIPFRRPA